MKRKTEADRRAVGKKMERLRKSLPPPNSWNAVAIDLRKVFQIEPGRRGVSKDTWKYAETCIGYDGQPHKANPETIIKMAAYLGWDPKEALAEYFDPEEIPGIPADAYRIYRSRHNPTSVEDVSSTEYKVLTPQMRREITSLVEDILRRAGLYSNQSPSRTSCFGG